MFSHIALKINNVCIVSHDQFTYDINAIDCSSNYRKIAIWADTDIRLIVKTTAHNVSIHKMSTNKAALTSNLGSV